MKRSSHRIESGGWDLEGSIRAVSSDSEGPCSSRNGNVLMAWLFFNQHADQVLRAAPPDWARQRYGGTATAVRCSPTCRIGGNGGS